MRGFRHRRAAWALIAAATLGLAGCAAPDSADGPGGSVAAPDSPAPDTTAAADLPPFAVPVPLDNPQGSCGGTATAHSSNDGWEQWPPDRPQFRLESPPDEPQWSATVTAICGTRDDAEASNPDIDWSVEGPLESMRDECPSPATVDVPGYEARLCHAMPQEDGGFTSVLVAMSDTHFIAVDVSILPDLRGTNGTVPGDVEQARPMLDTVEEALRNVTVQLH